MLTSDVKPDAAKIMATTTEVVFLYNGKNTWRLIPLNRPHDPINSRDQQPANSLTPASIAIEPAA